MNFDLESRVRRYHALSPRLAQIDNKRLASMLNGDGPGQGWGGTHVLKLGESKVFVKKIPLTDLECENMFSTENLYRLPLFYNYGVGSAGFGAFRELVAHVKTTHWTLEGAIENFPLLYHYRIVPRSGKPSEFDEERHRRYVKYWNGDEKIDRYLRERNNARYEISLFLEYVPHVLDPWLMKNGSHWERTFREMRRALAFLRGQGIVHFDVHFWNVLTDGERPYLTDFGLALDKSFDLNAEEKAFFNRHTDYDFAEFLSCVGSHLFSLYKKLPEPQRKRMAKRYGLAEDAGYYELSMVLLENVEEIRLDGRMNLDDHYAEQVVRNRDLIRTMSRFYSQLQANDKKDTRYPSGKVKRLLQESRFLEDGGPTPHSASGRQ
jgi:tRNA A-37 threonylcarbamoyl transferase component Bud32